MPATVGGCFEDCCFELFLGASGHCSRFLPLAATQERGALCAHMALLSPALSSHSGRRGSLPRLVRGQCPDAPASDAGGDSSVDRRG